VGSGGLTPHILTSAVGGVSGQLHASVTFSLGKKINDVWESQSLWRRENFFLSLESTHGVPDHTHTVTLMTGFFSDMSVRFIKVSVTA